MKDKMFSEKEYEFDGSKIQEVVKAYATLDYASKLSGLLSKLYPKTDFSVFEKQTLHQIINDTILKYYNGEQVLKYALFKHFSDKNIIAAFESRVNNSRADFLAINGSTFSFEIKSSKDNLDKLTKQAKDYQNVFEYNYIVIDQKHLEKADKKIPSDFGIWTFNNGKKKQHRPAVYNLKIKPVMQLNLLSKKELKEGFKKCEPECRKIIKTYSSGDINYRFKKILKARYEKRWKFIVTNSEFILPIDLQFFFNTNIEPRIIYLH